MDEDIDITKTNISEMFVLAEESGSPIVAPAIRFSENHVDEERRISLLECRPGSMLCAYQQADYRCRFSYTRWVEVMTPLLRPRALWHTIHECEGCITDATDWGIDSVWCSRSAKLFGLPKDQGCALLDQTSVVHTRGDTLPKHDSEDADHDFFKKSREWWRHVEELYPDDFVRLNGSEWKPQCVPATANDRQLGYTSLLQKSANMLSGRNKVSTSSFAVHKLLQHDPVAEEKDPTSKTIATNFSGRVADGRLRKLLLITAVGSKPENMNLVMANVNHLRKYYDGHVSVFLNHYDEANELWLRQNASWYADNVQNKSFVQGFKFPAVSHVISDFQQVADYSWIWVMDEDIDITKTNISEMFTVAEESGSPIVAPAIRFPPDIVDTTRRISLLQLRCSPGSTHCGYQKADPRCRFSYTRYIEVMTPLFRPRALWHTVRECEGCITDATDWGLDLIWCSRSAKLFNIPKHQGCALLDQSPVIHTSGKTLPIHTKKDRQERKWVTKTFDWLHHIEKAYPDDFVQLNGTWKPQCVPAATS